MAWQPQEIKRVWGINKQEIVPVTTLLYASTDNTRKKICNHTRISLMLYNSGRNVSYHSFHPYPPMCVTKKGERGKMDSHVIGMILATID